MYDAWCHPTVLFSGMLYMHVPRMLENKIKEKPKIMIERTVSRKKAKKQDKLVWRNKLSFI